jgi:hypothetical protein
VLNVLELKGDYYSLAFYGLYLDTDDEELSSHKCINEVKDVLNSDEHQDLRTVVDEKTKKKKRASELLRNLPKMLIENQAKKTRKFIQETKRLLREKRNIKNFFKLSQIFALQVILLYCLLYSLFLEYLIHPDLKPNLREMDENPYLTFVTKFCCSVLIHINMQPKIAEAIQRLNYIRDHPHKFERVTIAILICFMKIFVEFSVEIINLALTALQNACHEVVMNYVALASISELDEIYYQTIRSPLKDELEERNFSLDIKNTKSVKLTHGLHWWDRFLLGIVHVIQFFYEIVYFYMFPMFLFVFVFIEYGVGDS